MLIDISKIKVTDRIRQDFSGIEELAQDIAENGLINPIVVTSDYQLIAGERRLRAHQHLRRQEVAVNVMDVRNYAHHLQLEISENEHRRDFTFSERIAYGKKIEELERIKAKERMTAPDKENLPEGEKGQVRDIVAEQAGFGSGRNYDKAKFIAEHATAEIIQELDAGLISTHKAFTQTKERMEAAEKAAAEANARAEAAEKEKENLRKQYKDFIPADQLEEAVNAAIERQQEENEVFIAQKDKEAQAALKARDVKWKKDIEAESQKVRDLNAGYKRIQEELETLKLQQPEDLDEQQKMAQLKKLRYEADSNTVQLSIHVKQFLQKAAVTTLNLGSVASASSSEKKRFNESLDMLQTFIDQMRPAVNGRRVVEADVIN
ncbi:MULTISPECIES: ParB N-terminal domain-containing protein [unclassified Paenibacillus]|uniref:ParB N-terminal domain-containing protein n=1 Tax=unclassified Paenibacillus TaxID=185978 RepID=UPI00096CE0EE|nr:ParB N-terminal domain-containing protein [Paenibacillus sp. FSL H8-0259]OMF30914.1 plasmid-partitioning protein [Paenibacillus sp. FSL H8-0259]